MDVFPGSRTFFPGTFFTGTLFPLDVFFRGRFYRIPVARCPIFDRTVQFFGDLSGRKNGAKPDNFLSGFMAFAYIAYEVCS
jgi:hypothetical protein